MKSMNMKYCESIMINRRLGEAFDLMERVQDGRDGYHGLFTGIKSLDKLTNGWDPGDLVIIGGRPCSCKSTFALQMARNLAVDQDCATVYFSMTMSCAEVMNRLISAETGVPMEKLEGKVKLHIEDWNQMNASLRCLSRSPLYLDDTPGLRPSYIEERVELLSRQGMVRVVVIDLDCISEDEPQFKDYLKAFINGHIIESSKEENSFEEGCLSVPGIHESVKRPEKVRIQYLDADLQPHDEWVDGFVARVIQHEFDHLEGKMFVDRLSPLRKQIIKKKLLAMSKGKYQCGYKTKANH